MNEYKFEKLKVYQLAENIVVEVYKLLKKFPKEEIFGIVAQIKRAVISVALNIAEGSTNRTTKDFLRFISIGVGSLIETRAALKISVKLGFITEKELELVSSLFDELFFKLLALKKALSLHETNK